MIVTMVLYCGVQEFMKMKRGNLRKTRLKVKVVPAIVSALGIYCKELG